MSNHILNREMFVNEVYSQMSEEQLNEGIFDFFKTLAKNEWKNLKSKNSDILKKLEEADRGLTGFTLIKLKKAGACKSIRQALLDFANTLWEAKEKELKDNTKLQKMLMGLKDKDEVSDKEEEQLKKAGNVSKFMKQFGIKDKALADNLTSYEKKIKELCKGNPDLVRWSDMLKEDIRNIINRMIIDKCDDDEKKDWEEKLKKQEDEKKKADEKKNKEAEALQKKQIEEIEKEREKTLSSVGVTPLKGKSGDKAFTELQTTFQEFTKEAGVTVKEGRGYEYSFENIINESEDKGKKIKAALESDKWLGLKEIPELIDKAKVEDDKLIVKIIKEITIVFRVVDEIISKKTKLFKDVPGDSIQSLYVGLASVIAHAMTDGELTENTKELLARCAISDKTLGYGLPVIDKKDDGNMFVTITNTLMNLSNTKAFGTNKKLITEFKKNIKTMFQEVVNKAEELKKERQKQDEKDAQKAEQDSENEKK